MRARPYTTANGCDDGFCDIDEPESFAKLAGIMSREGLAYKLPLYRAASSTGSIALCQPSRGHQISASFLKRVARPLVVLLGDDDYSSTGPGGWQSTQRLLQWARAALLHGTGGTIAHYHVAVELTQQSKRLLLVETDAAHLPAWRLAVEATGRRLPTLVIAPTTPHPAVPPPGGVQ